MFSQTIRSSHLHLLRLRHIQKLPSIPLLTIRYHGTESSSTIKVRAAERLLKSPECDYLFPLYVENDGGHNHLITKWFYQEGDVVKDSTPLCEIDTDEFSYDFDCPEDGYLAQRTVDEGDAVEEQQLFAVLVKSIEEFDDYHIRLKETCNNIVQEEEEEKTKQLKESVGTEENAKEMVHRILETTGMEQYRNMFELLIKDDGFDTPCALKAITDEDLQESGVEKKGHRRALLRALEGDE